MRPNLFQSNGGKSAGMGQAALAAVGLLMAGASANAAFYNQVTTLAQLQPPTGSGTLSSASIDGNNAYGFFTIPQVTEVVGLNGTQSTSNVGTSAGYLAASGAASGGSGILWNATSTSLLIADNTGHSIVRIDKGTGAASTYYSSAQIKAVTGDTGTPSLTESAITSTGEIDVYDNGSSKGLFTTDGGFQSLISNATLTAGMGNGTVSAFTVAGTEIIIGNSTSHAIFGYNTTNGTFTTLLTTAQIAAVNGTAAENFTPLGMYYAPDGNIYYDEAGNTVNKDIMEFNLSNPAGTLTTVLTGAQLLAGPANSATVSNFSFYNGNLAWTEASPSGSQVAGIYVVPEPTTALVVISAAGLLSMRNRRKASR